MKHGRFTVRFIHVDIWTFKGIPPRISSFYAPVEGIPLSKKTADIVYVYPTIFLLVPNFFSIAYTDVKRMATIPLIFSLSSCEPTFPWSSISSKFLIFGGWGFMGHSLLTLSHIWDSQSPPWRPPSYLVVKRILCVTKCEFMYLSLLMLDLKSSFNWCVIYSKFNLVSNSHSGSKAQILLSSKSVLCYSWPTNNILLNCLLL